MRPVRTGPALPAARLPRSAPQDTEAPRHQFQMQCPLGTVFDLPSPSGWRTQADAHLKKNDSGAAPLKTPAQNRKNTPSVPSRTQIRKPLLRLHLQNQMPHAHPRAKRYLADTARYSLRATRLSQSDAKRAQPPQPDREKSPVLPLHAPVHTSAVPIAVQKNYMDPVAPRVQSAAQAPLTPAKHRRTAPSPHRLPQHCKTQTQTMLSPLLHQTCALTRGANKRHETHRRPFASVRNYAPQPTRAQNVTASEKIAAHTAGAVAPVLCAHSGAQMPGATRCNTCRSASMNECTPAAIRTAPQPVPLGGPPSEYADSKAAPARF